MVIKVQKPVDVPQIEYEDKIFEVFIQKPVHLALLSKIPYRSVVGRCRFGWTRGDGRLGGTLLALSIAFRLCRPFMK